MEPERTTYLGDGLYAELDDSRQIRLYAANNEVWLEPEVFAAFCRFAVSIGWGNLMRENLRKENPPTELPAD